MALYTVTDSVTVLHAADVNQLVNLLNGVDTTTAVTAGSSWTFSKQVTLSKGAAIAAGTASVAPLTFTSGTNLTSATAGVVEYDGKAFYLTPVASNRGVASLAHVITQTADFTGANSTAAQPIFNGSANGTITLPASTSYYFEGSFHIHTTGTANHTFGILFGGTATLTDIGFMADTTNAATEVLGASQRIWITVATVTVLTAATATATHHSTIVKGIVRTNGAGTFIPQYQWGTTAPGVAGVTLKDSYFLMTPLGGSGVATVGNWS